MKCENFIGYTELMIKIWGNNKNLISAVRTGVCPCERYAPGTEMRFSKRDRGNAYSAKITRIPRLQYQLVRHEPSCYERF